MIDQNESNERSRRNLLQFIAAATAVGAIGSAASVAATRAMQMPIRGRIGGRYVEGRFGQIHIRSIHPDRRSGRTPVMCFHPNPLSSDFYGDFMLELGRDREMFAMDTPGYGNSARPPAPPSMADLAGSAADALDRLGFGRRGRGPVDLVGYHTGCLIAVELAVTRPDLVRRLVLPGIPFYTAVERPAQLSKYSHDLDVREDGSHLAGVWKFWVTDRERGVALDRAAAHVADQLRAEPYSWWAYNAVFSYAAETRFPLVRQPVIVPNSRAGLFERSKAAAALMPNARVIDLPDLRNGIFDLAAPQLAGIARDFLDPA
jgi:pimeloyl-ACP methyl ester carboxylesterase